MESIYSRPAAAPILVHPAGAAKAHLSADRRLSDAASSIQKPHGLLSLFTSKEIRQLRNEVDAVAAEQAAALAIRRTEMARDTVIQAIDLNLKQRLAEIGHAETATTTELQKQAQAAGTRAIKNAVSQEHLLQKDIQKSRCAPADKALLSEFLKQLTRVAMESVYHEHVAPFSQSGTNSTHEFDGSSTTHPESQSD